jgi:hypothetical protein
LTEGWDNLEGEEEVVVVAAAAAVSPGCKVNLKRSKQPAYLEVRQNGFSTGK